ncbi:type IV toxin-antitoxin system AbiEi family antitoxin domain-containing protein [Cumulibacter manganitolerans]|uniref:type IV toxin-antitoxin system AbiEi family antitoxin domain-containing protein n=1 Tax=Cumulibacter manganitolerans TaxID=1884992 RepID=UPI0012979E0C|nr:type IV toxin-antitoxin system AbiEi family antitoxin domain-containing protein [Cumulibacter manganitolerans]
MHARTRLPDAVRELAQGRHGVLTRTDLERAGLPRGQVAALCQELPRLMRGTYLLPGDHDPWMQKVVAGLLSAGEGSAAWGRTAAALWGLGERPSVIEVLSDKHRPATEDWLRIKRDPVLLRRVVDVEPCRVALEDAVIDASASGDRASALALVARALQERRTTPERLLAVARGRHRLRHRALLLDAIGPTAAGAHSALEHLYRLDVEQAHRLPPMRRQHLVPTSGHHADGGYPEHRLLIELDGVRYHDLDADTALDNRHSAAGYRTLRFGWPTIDADPCGVASTVAAALLIALPRRCRRCP